MKMFYILLGLLFSLPLFSQDPVFSQFYNNRVYLNPAFAGAGECFTARLNYRDQWHRVPGGFETFSATFEFFIPAIRVGIAPFLLKDQEGAGHLSYLQSGLALSAFHPLGDRSSIHIGAMASYMQKSADLSRFVFSDQLDPVTGLYDPLTGLANATQAPAIEQVSYPDLNIGALFRTGFDLFSDEALADFGIAYHHLLKPQDALTAIGRVTQPRLTIHFGATLPVWVDHYGSEKYHLYISPQIVTEWQQHINVFSAGSYFMYRHIYSGAFLRFSNSPFSRRNTDAVVVHFGFELPFEDKPLTIGFSYDINYSGLSTSPGGIWELSLIWQNCQWLSKTGKGYKPPKNSFKGCPASFL